MYFRHFVQQATSEKKRSAAARRPRNISTSSRLDFTILLFHLAYCLYVWSSITDRSVTYAISARSLAYTDHLALLLYLLGMTSRRYYYTPWPSGDSSSPVSERNTPPWFKAAFGPWNSGRLQSYGGINMQTTTPTLLHHLLAPPER